MTKVQELFMEETRIEGDLILAAILKFLDIVEVWRLADSGESITYMINKEGKRCGKINITKGYILITKVEEPF